MTPRSTIGYFFNRIYEQSLANIYDSDIAWCDHHKMSPMYYLSTYISVLLILKAENALVLRLNSINDACDI